MVYWVFIMRHRITILIFNKSICLQICVIIFYFDFCFSNQMNHFLLEYIACLARFKLSKWFFRFYIISGILGSQLALQHRDIFHHLSLTIYMGFDHDFEYNPNLHQREYWNDYYGVNHRWNQSKFATSSIFTLSNRVPCWLRLQLNQTLCVHHFSHHDFQMQPDNFDDQ